MKKNNIGIEKANKDRKNWEFALRMTENHLHWIKTENPKICDVYDQKGHRFLKGLNIEYSQKYRNKKGYKIKMVDNKKAIIEVEKIIRFLKKKVGKINL